MNATDESVAFGELVAIVGRVLNREAALTTTTQAAEIAGWDSHATVEIIFEVEERFGFQLSNTEMEEVDGIPSLLRLIAAHVEPAEASS